MLEKAEVINGLETLNTRLQSEDITQQINRACLENLWFTHENYLDVVHHWNTQLTSEVLLEFSSAYTYATEAKNIGLVMAGNIPMVGFHDLLCVLLSGHKAKVKLASTDKSFMNYLIAILFEINGEFKNHIELVENVKNVDGVIATGSNNSYRYFEYYFNDIPSLLRKSRKSIAILEGNETKEDLKRLGTDVFKHFGLGCRNVSLVLLPSSMNITSVLDEWGEYIDLLNHNKYANNYNYHKALFLMNQQEHLDTNYVLLKNERSLACPLGCLYYNYYENREELDGFLEQSKEEIQCVVGNYSIPFGMAQYPDLHDFADGENTMQFLEKMN